MHQQLGGGLASTVAREEGTALAGIVPWAGVAALVSESEGALDEAAPRLEGKAFCFLPLPPKTGLPVHVRLSRARAAACSSAALWRRRRDRAWPGQAVCPSAETSRRGHASAA